MNTMNPLKQRINDMMHDIFEFKSIPRHIKSSITLFNCFIKNLSDVELKQLFKSYNIEFTNITVENYNDVLQKIMISININPTYINDLTEFENNILFQH